MEVALLRVDALRREIEALDQAVKGRVSSLEQRLGATEATVEMTVRAHKARIHRSHDKRLQMRDLHDGAVESETVQKVAGSLSQELGGRRSLDALVASADAALLEERWQGLRWAFDLSYRAWGIFCLYVCLLLASIFPPLADRFGFHPAPQVASGVVHEPPTLEHSADGSRLNLRGSTVAGMRGGLTPPDDLDPTFALSGVSRSRLARPAAAQLLATSTGRSSL